MAFNVSFDHKCYWTLGAGKRMFGGRDWAAWRKQGMDADSVVADPQFAGVAKDDFHLPTDSPAVKVGFVPFDLSGYGPRVQLSVFEVELADRDKAQAFRDRLRTLIDDDDDQVRLYPLPADSWARRLVYGNRTLEERVDYWIV